MHHVVDGIAIINENNSNTIFYYILILMLNDDFKFRLFY